MLSMCFRGDDGRPLWTHDETPLARWQQHSRSVLITEYERRSALLAGFTAQARALKERNDAELARAAAELEGQRARCAARRAAAQKERRRSAGEIEAQRFVMSAMQQAAGFASAEGEECASDPHWSMADARHV